MKAQNYLVSEQFFEQGVFDKDVDTIVQIIFATYLWVIATVTYFNF